MGAVFLGLQLYALGAEIAVLRNGSTIRCERRQQNGDTTRLFTSSGFLDVPTVEIVSFEPDDTPPDPPKATLETPKAAVTPAVQGSPDAQASQAPVAVAPAGVAPAGVTPVGVTPVNLDEVVREASSRHQLDPDFVNSVIKAESNFQARAVSRKGAQGLMQLMPGTAAQLGVTNAFDPRANVEGGTAYLSYLLTLYHDDAVKALAAYNAGPERVDRYHGLPPYMETRAYVARIVHDYNAKKRAQMKAQAAQKNAAVAKNKDTRKKTAAPAQPRQAGVNKPQKPA